MSISRSKQRIAVAAAVLATLSGAAVAGSADAAVAGSAAPLTVVAAGPTISPANQAVSVTVAVTNSANQVLCTPFTVTLTWWRAAGRRYSLSRGAPNQLGTTTTTMHIPEVAMRPGQVHYVATASQQCGLLAPTITYEGRWPARGSASVTAL